MKVLQTGVLASVIAALSSAASAEMKKVPTGHSASLSQPMKAIPVAGDRAKSAAVAKACGDLSQGRPPAPLVRSAGGVIPVTSDGQPFHELSMFMRESVTEKTMFETDADYQAKMRTRIEQREVETPFIAMSQPLRDTDIDYKPETQTLFFDRQSDTDWQYRTPNKSDVGNNSYRIFFGDPKCYAGRNFRFQLGGYCASSAASPFYGASRFSTSMPPESARSLYEDLKTRGINETDYEFFGIFTLKPPFFSRDQVSTIVFEDVFYTSLQCAAVLDKRDGRIIAYWPGASNVTRR